MCSFALCYPMNYSPLGPSVHGFLQERILEQIAISFSRASSWPRDQTHITCISCIGRQVLYRCAIWKARKEREWGENVWGGWGQNRYRIQGEGRNLEYIWLDLRKQRFRAFKHPAQDHRAILFQFYLFIFCSVISHHCWVQASHCRDFSCCRVWALGPGLQ